MKRLIIDTGTSKTGICILEDGRYAGGTVLAYDDVIRSNGSTLYSEISVRRDARMSRRHYENRRLRTISLLKFLSDNKYGPFIPNASLNKWRYNQTAPQNILDNFISGHCPYKQRVTLLNETLDMNVHFNRYTFGRALLSMTHSRGYDFEANDDNAGEYANSTSELYKVMAEHNFTYVSELFLYMIENGERIRGKYYVPMKLIKAEFNAICQKQNIPDSDKKRLEKIIFSQPVNKNKAKRNNCPFEKDRKVCYDSHPAFEEYRMWQIIRNIYVIDIITAERRLLTDEEIEKVIPVFYKFKSDFFKFSNIKNVLKVSKTNFEDDEEMPSCKFSSSIARIFSDDETQYHLWKTEAAYRLSRTLHRTVTEDAAADMIWNVCFQSKDTGKSLDLFFQHKLEVSNFDASKITISSNTTSLSVQACRNITYWMREYKMRSWNAVVMLNIPVIIREHMTSNYAEEVEKAHIDIIADALVKYDSKVDDVIPNYLSNILNKYLDNPVTQKELSKKLLDIRSTEKYTLMKKNGKNVLPLPADSIGSQAVYRVMCTIRKYINELILSGKIDKDTKVIIESGRSTMTINERAASDKIKRMERDNKKRIVDIITKLSRRPLQESEIDTLTKMYQLWEETGGICIWTGRKIDVKEIIDRRCDLEHTIPISNGGYSSMENLTICDRNFNQKVKRDTMPGLMSNINDVMDRVKDIYGKKVEELQDKIKKNKWASKKSNNPEQHARLIVERIIMENKLQYYTKKMNNFCAVEEPDEFSASQGHTNDYVIKKTRIWLKSFFRSVNFSRSENMDEARERWKVDKDRTRNSNHLEDAFIHGVISEYGLTYKIPYPEFYDDINKIRKTCITVTKGHRSYMKPAHYKSGSGYGKKLHYETKYAIRDYSKYGIIRIPASSFFDKKISNRPKLENIVSPEIREIVRKAQDAGLDYAIDPAGKIIRHIRVEYKQMTVNNAVKVPTKIKTSENPDKNYFYYGSNGASCAGYYEDGHIITLNAFDEANGKTLPQYFKDTEYKLKYVLRVGDNVAVYRDDETPDVFNTMSQEEYSKRIFYIKEIISTTGYGRLKLVHNDYNPKERLTTSDDVSLLGKEYIRVIIKSKINLVKLKNDEMIKKLY